MNSLPRRLAPIFPHSLSQNDRRSVVWRLPLVAVSVVLLAGCGGATRPPSSKLSHSAKKHVPAGFAKPTSFAETGVPLPAAADANTSIGGSQEGAPPVALLGTTAFVTTGKALDAVDGLTGRRIAFIAPKDTVLDPPGQGDGFVGSGDAPPYVAMVNGRNVALAGYVVQLPGNGTTPPSAAVEIDAATDNGHLAWSMVVDVQGDISNVTGSPIVSLLGVTGTTAVALVGDQDDGETTMAFDLSSHKLLWQNGAFQGVLVSRDAVLGTTASDAGFLGADADSAGNSHIASVSVQTGKTIWTAPEQVSSASFAGAGFGGAIIQSQNYRTGAIDMALTNTRTGRAHVIARYSADGSGGVPWACQEADQSVVTCWATESNAQVFAIGAGGKVLWELPDKTTNRIAPTVTGVYAGYIYGTTPNGPVVLNADTGADADDSPGAAPLLVDSNIAIAISPKGGLDAYRVTG